VADEQNDTKESGQTDTPKTEDVVFSAEQQAKLNDIISKRLAERDAQHQKEMTELGKKHQRELEKSKMDESTRHKAEEEDRIKAITERAENAERQLRIAKASEELVKAGLDTTLAETLMGADDEMTKANIAAVAKAAEARAKQMYAERVGSSGAPKAPTSGGSSDLFSRMRIAAKLPPKGGQ